MSHSAYSSATDTTASIVRCPYSKCHARIIKPKDATVHTIKTGITYLKVNESQEPTYDDKFLKIEDVWDFDNIGVSKQFENKEESEVVLERLIICSVCERGPLGFATFENGSKDVKDLKYYLHVNSVVYDVPK